MFFQTSLVYYNNNFIIKISFIMLKSLSLIKFDFSKAKNKILVRDFIYDRLYNS